MKTLPLTPSDGVKHALAELKSAGLHSLSTCLCCSVRVLHVRGHVITSLQITALLQAATYP